MEFAQRMIFPYFDGEKQVFGDPLEIHDRLTDLLDGDPEHALQLARPPGLKDADGKELPGNPDPRSRYEAKRRLDAAVVTAFELIPFDRTTGNGANRLQRATALSSFCSWMEANRKKNDASPTSPGPAS